MPHPHFVLKVLPETHQGILVFWALDAWTSCLATCNKSCTFLHHNATSVDWLYYVQVQFSHSVVSDSLWPHGLQHTRFPCPSPTPRLYSTHIHWVCDAIKISQPLSSFSPAFNLSQHQGLFKWVSSSHQVAKVLEFQLQINPSNEYSGLISFRMDWLDLFAVERTLKSLLQHHSSKASIFWSSTFFMVQPSHPHMTTGKTIAFTRWSVIGKLKSLLFNMLSILVITFLPRSKCLLISWLQSPSAVILEPPQIKYFTVSTASHLFAIKWWDWMPWS